MKKAVAIEIISSFLAMLFAYTAFSKFMHNGEFRATLERVPFLPFGAAVLALATPLAELVTVLLLLFPATQLKGFYASLLLLSLFTLYLLAMLFIAPKLPCSCGGVINGMGWKEHVAFNLFFIGLTVAGIRSYKVGSAGPGTSPG